MVLPIHPRKQERVTERQHFILINNHVLSVNSLFVYFWRRLLFVICRKLEMMSFLQAFIQSRKLCRKTVQLTLFYRRNAQYNEFPILILSFAAYLVLFKNRQTEH